MGNNFKFMMDNLVIKLLILCPMLYIVYGDEAHAKCEKLCPDSRYCRTKEPVHKQSKEVVLVTEGNSSHKDWPLDYVTMILSLNMKEDDAIKLSCYAHQNNVNYAFIAEVPPITNISDPNFHTWLYSTKALATNTYSDFVVFDFLNLVNKCHQTDGHTEDVMGVVTEVHRIFAKLGPQKMICIMPWKPPCFGSDCTLAVKMVKMCEIFIINPESFISTCDNKCNARATVPLSSLVLGIDEYLNTGGLHTNRLMMGIPWHGYDYTCDRYLKQKAIEGADICYVAKTMDENNHTRCDFGSGRLKVTIPHLTKNFREIMDSTFNWNPVNHAPYFAYNITKNGNSTQHQIWYENVNTLWEKYRLARDLSLRGIVIYTADDVEESHKIASSEYSWLIHKLFVTGKYTEHKDSLNVAAIAAGIGVGCLILGAAIGFFVGCVVSDQRNNRKKHLRLPFSRDEDIPDYHDDDAAL